VSIALVGLVRVKIWRLGSGEVIYDARMGAPDHEDPIVPMGGGSVVVHSGC
jgi:hypothetical protein